MKVRINKGVARGRIDAPPSKSMAHRLLICAGLSEGECTVHGISESEDVLATLDCLKAIGAKWKRDKDAITVTGADIRKIPAGKHRGFRFTPVGSGNGERSLGRSKSRRSAGQ